MDAMTLTQFIKAKAIELGFDQIGVASAEKIDPHHLRAWLQSGHHGALAYMSRHEKLRTDPRLLVPGARTILVLAMNYYQEAEGPGTAMVSRYAWGDDYHHVLKNRLKRLLEFMKDLAPDCQGRVFVDSAPVMEKVWASRAGIGWQGKHSLITSPYFGTWIFLGEIICNLKLVPDEPVKNHCGTCRLCIDACPTQAIIQPYVVDARCCISYLTIEAAAKEKIPKGIADRLGGRIFGCDICQEVCPWNDKTQKHTREPEFQPHRQIVALTFEELRVLTERTFKERFRNSSILRMKYEGLVQIMRWVS